MLLFVSIVICLIGYVIGLRAPLLLQLCVIVGAVFYLKYQRSFEELASIIVAVWFLALIAGMFIGNTVYAITYFDQVNMEPFKAAFKWLFIP